MDCLAKFLRKLSGALTFYTALPQIWAVDFEGIATYAPLVGGIIGTGLGIVAAGLTSVTMAPLTCSSLMVGLWIALTGGLHLDGVMDSGDGLAVTDGDRRLEVMADSKTGAFGVMAGLVVILFKVTALADLIPHLSSLELGLVFINTCAWARWGQLLAIYRYPYLRSGGKGAFHKAAVTTWMQLMPATGFLGFLMAWQVYLNFKVATIAGLLAMAIASLSGAWFNYKFGGHTGDTYGAVVEWTEALVLMGLSVVVNNLG